MTALRPKPPLAWLNGLLGVTALVCLQIWFAPIAFADEADKSTEPPRIEADMVLGELNHLADELEKQRKFSRILLKKIDSMQERMEALETALANRTEGHKSQPEEDKTQKEASKQQTPKDQQADKEQSQPSGTDDFEQFLDMGEAMLRRFFGVVKELRKEFEDNRA